MSDDQQQTGVTRDWVKCPICDESDMRRERDPEGDTLIFCVNYNCASNGGTNMNGIKLQPAPIPVGQELVPTAFMEMVGLLVVVSDGLVQAHQEVEEAEATLKNVSGAAHFLHLGTRDEAVKTRGAFLKRLGIATSGLRITLARRAAAALKKYS
jgi:hypothetical protein